MMKVTNDITTCNICYFVRSPYNFCAKRVDSKFTESVPVADPEVKTWGGVGSSAEGTRVPPRIFFLTSGNGAFWWILNAIFADSSNLKLYWLLCFTAPPRHLPSGEGVCPSPEFFFHFSSENGGFWCILGGVFADCSNQTLYWLLGFTAPSPDPFLSGMGCVPPPQKMFLRFWV